MFAINISVLLLCLVYWLEAIDQEKMSMLLNYNNRINMTPLEMNFNGHIRNRQLGNVLGQLMTRLNRINSSRTTTSRRNSFNLENVTSTTTTTQASPIFQSIQEDQLRLVGGRTHFEGNIEIMHNGKWGSVCDDEWDQTDADIACRQIGFVLGAIEATNNGRYGKAKSK